VRASGAAGVAVVSAVFGPGKDSTGAAAALRREVDAGLGDRLAA
jgi:thiamine monophosphate synthase